jgi:ABC-type nickel/cobalt efflux system permease component RcnA
LERRFEMENEMVILYGTAAAIGFLHTLFGPDHYLPFIVMAKAREWSYVKTSLITLACGIGHILSSVVIGFIGILFGIAVMKLEALEALRGNIAAWALIGFGLAYCIWGIRSAARKKPHSHAHSHDNTDMHEHEHAHFDDHSHQHQGKANITPWILFTIFILGPCEPLIPILMYPASKNSIVGLLMVTAIFGIVTITTMFSIVMLGTFGVKIVALGRLERYSHAMAGGAILVSGLAIQFLGL